MPSIYYLCRKQAENANQMFGNCEYTEQARDILKDTHATSQPQFHLRKLCSGYPATRKHNSENHILFHTMARNVQPNFQRIKSVISTLLVGATQQYNK
jgi:hypothetical protein